MKLVIFGLTVSSSWGNGHATLWRGLCRALGAEDHRVVFYERDVPYYRAHRDLIDLPLGGKLRLYADWHEVAPFARRDLDDADAGLVTSYCPDGVAATELMLQSRAARRVFYDLDTPVTLTRLAAGETLTYIGSRGLRDFDLVLSYTGGAALDALRERLGAPEVAALYGSVDPELHRPAPSQPHYAADLSYLGTFSEDRQQKLETLFLRPAADLPDSRFVIGGAQYPQSFPWSPNIWFVRHLPPSEHPAFFSSARFALNVTRRSMAVMGFCPSGRLFEAAACGAPIISDDWRGIDSFFEPQEEIVIAHSAAAVKDALAMPEEQRRGIARRARERALDEHTAARRARTLLALLEAPVGAAPAAARSSACGA